MKNIHPFLTACLFVTTLSHAQSMSPAAKQILPLLHEQRLAANAHDTDAFLHTYLHDDSLVFLIDGRVIRGFDALRQQQLKWWKDGKSDVVYTERARPEIVTLDSQTALVTEQFTGRRTGPDGKPTSGDFVVTTIWHKLPGGWRVTYGHESWTR